jgi:20S proteasome subunit beta 2
MYTQNVEKTGFDFSLVERNKTMEEKHLVPSQKFKKTGTTICALMHKDGIVFAADSRATAGSVVMDLECIKVHQMAPNIYAAGAGTAADLFAVINLMASELELQRMNTGNESRLSHVEQRLHDHLFRHMGHIGVALIIGGIDVNGPDIVNFLFNYVILACHVSPW